MSAFLSKLLNLAPKNETENEFKSRVVSNISKANSREYKRDKAELALGNMVIDDMLKDPYWREVIQECKEAGTL